MRHSRDYPVDFFLALPDEAACQAARARLEPEFSVDVKPLRGRPSVRFSLHATKNMRLIVPRDAGDQPPPDARSPLEFGGRYDGWAA